MSDQSTKALEELVRAKVTVTDDGDMQVPTEVLQAVRAHRVRGATTPQVPSTPRHMNRDGGGVGVRKGDQKWPSLSMDELRAIRERSPIFQSIHAARRHQVARMARKWSGKKQDVGWKVVHKNHQDYNAVQPDGFQRWIDRFENLLETPAPYHECKTTGSLLSRLEEDLLTINRPTIEVLHSHYDPERMVGFRPVDGAIVWPTLLWLEVWKQKNPGWAGGYQGLTTHDALEIASIIEGHDLFMAEYALVRDGILENVYARGSLLCEPELNRTSIELAGYPPSHVEEAAEQGASFLAAWEYNTGYFTRGMMAEFLLGLPAGMHADDATQFRNDFREASQGVRRAHQPLILPMPDDGSKIEKIPLKDSNKEMMYEVWISLTMSLAAAVYRMDPSSINVKPWDGGAGPSLSEANRDMEIALAKEEGLQHDLEHLVSHVLDPLARRVHPDLRVMMWYGDHDPVAEADLYSKRGQLEMTRNEIRIEQGMAPRGFWVPDDEVADLPDDKRKEYEQNLWNMPADPTFVNAMQQQAMLDAQDQGAEGMPPGAQGMPPGAEGMPPGEGDADGFGAPPGDADGFGGGGPAEGDGFGSGPGGPVEGDGFGGNGGAPPFGEVPEGLQKSHPVTVYVYDL